MGDSVRVLVVEDDEEINHQLFHLLSERGYLVDQAFDGQAALQQTALTVLVEYPGHLKKRYTLRQQRCQP